MISRRDFGNQTSECRIPNSELNTQDTGHFNNVGAKWYFGKNIKSYLIYHYFTYYYIIRAYEQHPCHCITFHQLRTICCRCIAMLQTGDRNHICSCVLLIIRSNANKFWGIIALFQMNDESFFGYQYSGFSEWSSHICLKSSWCMCFNLQFAFIKV